MGNTRYRSNREKRVGTGLAPVPTRFSLSEQYWENTGGFLSNVYRLELFMGCAYNILPKMATGGCGALKAHQK